MKKIKSTAFVLIIAVVWLTLMILFAPKDTLVGTWHEDSQNYNASQPISLVFEANGKETQRLNTVHGLIVAKGNYTLSGIILKHTFSSFSVNGKPISPPVLNPNQGYRCKVSGNGLELDSHALVADVLKEHYLPLPGKQILLVSDK